MIKLWYYVLTEANNQKEKIMRKLIDTVFAVIIGFTFIYSMAVLIIVVNYSK